MNRTAHFSLPFDLPQQPTAGQNKTPLNPTRKPSKIFLAGLLLSLNAWQRKQHVCQPRKEFPLLLMDLES
jgi:hypothetical protein